MAPIEKVFLSSKIENIGILWGQFAQVSKVHDRNVRFGQKDWVKEVTVRG